MVREILTINVGQCGVQLGECVWNQYCAEYNIDKNGKFCSAQTNNYSHYQTACFFDENDTNKWLPRNLMVDLEPNVIDNVLCSSYRSIFNPQFLLHGKEDAANNFARGYYTMGKEIIDIISDRIRKLVNNCHNCQGFIINHSVSAGTGSGLGSLILKTISDQYPKKTKIGCEVYPQPYTSNANVISPYNALLTTDCLLDNTDISLVFDNEQIYEIYQKWLNTDRPSYNNLNLLISKIISSLTSTFRFENESFVNLQELQTHLVPFPRLHFMISSMSPIYHYNKTISSRMDVQSVSESVVGASNFFTKIADFDAEEDKYMAMGLYYSGDIKMKEINRTFQWLKTNFKCSFVEWCPTGIKIAINKDKPATLKEDVIDLTDYISRVHGGMIGNNTAIARVFSRRISKKYDLLFHQRAFVYWYIAEGMEENEFIQARDNLGFLEKDYLDVLYEGSDESSD